MRISRKLPFFSSIVSVVLLLAVPTTAGPEKVASRPDTRASCSTPQWNVTTTNRSVIFTLHLLP